MNNFDLEKQLATHIEHNPDQAPRYLDIISKALIDYKKAIDTDRSNIAMNALSEMLAYSNVKKWKDKRVPFMINSAFILFPKGNCNGHTQACVDFFNFFVQCCKEEKVLEDSKDWLCNVKGIQYYNWLKNLMESMEDVKQ